MSGKRETSKTNSDSSPDKSNSERNSEHENGSEDIPKSFRWETLQEESDEDDDIKSQTDEIESIKDISVEQKSPPTKPPVKVGRDVGSKNEGKLHRKKSSARINRRQSTSSTWTASTSKESSNSKTNPFKSSPSSASIAHIGTDPPSKQIPNDTLSIASGSTVGDGMSKILYHALKGEWAQVEMLIRYCQKGDPELFVVDDDTGINPFMLAARDNKLIIVERLIELGINVNDRARDGRNALHFAAASAKEDVVNVLLKKRTDCTVKGGEKEQLPLHMACSRSGSDSRSIMQLLLKTTPASMRLLPDKDGNIPLFLSIESGNQGACKDLLTSHSEQQLKYEKTGSLDIALHLACRRRDLEMVRMFADYNTPVNNKNADGKTSLHIAAYMGDEAIVKYLYTMKADPNVYDHIDRSPLHVAAEQGHTGVVDVLTDKFKSSVLARTKDGSTLMHIAAQCGHPDTAIAFLKKGVPLHMPNKSGAVCLHAAAKNGHTVVVKALLTKGAHVEARTKDNFTALHVAVQHCRPLVVQMLLGYGAPVQVAGGKLQETPLHLASKIKGGDKVAEMLLKSGAEPNCPREDGETAVHMAARNGHVDTFKLLLEESGSIMLQSKMDENPLHVAVRHCRWHIVKEAIKFLEQQSKLDVAICINMENKEGETSVHLAAELTSERSHFNSEEENIMSLLLQHGGDLNYCTKLTQETPLHYAARSGNEGILKIFIDRIGPANMPTTINKQAKNGWSPLLFASEEGHDNCVYALLKQQARVDVFDENGKAALHLAAENGRLEIAVMLLKYKAFVNAKTKLGLTPLHLAAQNGYNDLVKILIEMHDASIDARSLDKKTPLHKAAENGQYDVCESLLNAGANVQMVDNKGQTPLHLAAENDHSKVVEQFLMHQPELVTMTNKAGSTCAHIAASKGSVAVIVELLKFDADNVTKFRNKTSQTALLLAAKGGHADVVKKLIYSGARVMDEDAEGMNALHLLAKYGHTHVIDSIKNNKDQLWRMTSSKTGFNALHVATQFGKEEFAREMLIFISATVASEASANRQDNVKDTSQEYGFTPLHLASQSGHVNLVRMILNCPGVNVSAGTAVQNMTPLHLSAQCGHTAVVGLLLSKDLDQLGAKDAQGFTSLHYAACNGHLEMVSLLLGQGAKIDTSDKNNWTPLHLAAKSGYLEMVKLLTEGGASTTAETNNGKIPIQHAAAAGHYAVVSYLLKQNHNTHTLLEDRTFVVDLMRIAVASSPSAPESNAPTYMAAQGGSIPMPVVSSDSRPATPRGRAGRVPAHLLPQVSIERVPATAGNSSGKKMEILQEFVLVSPAPLETAAKLSRAFMLLSNRVKEEAKGLQECARFSESLAVELLGICSAPKGANDILKATDNKGVPFLDVLIDCEQKNVIADPAVQKYLSDVWVGNLKWSDGRLILLCFSFLLCPPVWIFFSLPIDVGLNKVPIIKFIVYLVSHIYLVLLFIITCAVPLDPIYSAKRLDLIPPWYEWLLLVWVSGVLVNELTSPTDRTGIGWVRTLILSLCAISVVVHLVGFAFNDDRQRQEIIYARNMFLSAAMTLSFVQFLEFLSFHYLFGPWSIIIEGLLKDLFKFGVIVLMFMIAFTMWLAAVYQPVYQCEGNTGSYCPNETIPIVDNGLTYDPQHIQYPQYSFQLIFFALFGLIEPDVLPPVSRNPVFTIYLVQFVFGLYNIIMLIVLINLLIAMMSDTYQRIEAQSDTEWKFGRSKLIRNMKKTTLSPAPLNLMTTLYQYAKLCYKHKGRVCDPSTNLNTEMDDIESLPDSRSPDAHINQTWRLKKRKPGNRGVSPSMSSMPLNDANSLHRQKSLQDIVRWSDIRQKFWTIKGKDVSSDPDGGGYSILAEKDEQRYDKTNGISPYVYNNNGAALGSSDSNLPLPGKVIEDNDRESVA
ncbi:uncharacterized protein LOC120346782 isoform X1 [Styela clava]